jgi:4-hydroxy-tetrahydrodipicolinate synthase
MSPGAETFGRLTLSRLSAPERRHLADLTNLLLKGMPEMFTGSLVALITPFRDDAIDEAALRNLVEWQIREGTNGIVPCGTTGEAATMTDEEWEFVVATVVEQAAGRVPVIPGTGTNNTRSTIERTRRAQDLGATAALIATPYYNKPSPEGIYRHYAAIADAVDLPLVPYNVPGRTGTNMTPETVIRLTRIPGVVAIKESSGDVDQSSEIIAGADRPINVLSGDDSLTLPIMSVGGVGVISVLANIAPGPVARMTHEFLNGYTRSAQQLHRELFPLARAMFVETNPVPVKAAAAWLGLCSDEVRLPLAPLTSSNRERVIEALRRSPHTSPLAAATALDLSATVGVEAASPA